MDIHRCRFVPYNPQAINALAFSHPPSADLPGRGPSTLRLAIGRANGDIEIWNPHRGLWFQESILRGGKDRSIEALVWTLDPSEEDENGIKLPGKLRLFSIGYSSVVTEWDLEQGRPARHSSGNYGEIWCLAAQPRWKPTRKGSDGKPLSPAEGEYTGQHLAVGCADGSIVILSTEDGDLRYLRTLRPSTKRSRVLSITFQDRNMIIAGYADSSMRVFDLRNGQLKRTISLGKGPAKGSKELLVWSVKCLADGTIVSGDSAGEVRFWDAKNYSLIQRIHSHQADVLDIAVSGASVVSGGADQRTVVYRPKEGDKGPIRWGEVAHRRYHTHDVKTLAVYETKDISIVVSGGLDTIPVVVPLREYDREHHRKLSNLPRAPQLSSSPTSQLLMSWWDREVNFWRFFKAAGAPEQQHKLVGKVLFQGEENLSAAALSPDGKLLVAATVAEVKMFSLTQKGEEDLTLQVRKLELPSSLAKYGARALAVSPDCQWLFLVRPNNKIYMARIVNDADSEPRILPKLAKLHRTPRQKQIEKLQHGSLGAYDRSIHTVTFSSDSRIVACADISGCMDIWLLQGSAAPALTNGEAAAESSDDDSSDDEEPTVLYGQSWQHPPLESPLPRLKSGIVLISFRPSTSSMKSTSQDDRLMVLTTDHQLSEFTVLTGKLSDWSRRNPKAYLPIEFSTVKDRAMGALWDVADGKDRLWLYGPTWLWMFDLSQDFPSGNEEEHTTTESNAVVKSANKRKRDDQEDFERAKKINTGAGDRIPLSESAAVLGGKMRKVTGKKMVNAQEVDLNPARKPTEDEDDDDYNYSGTSHESTLARLRREQPDTADSDDLSDDEEDDKDTCQLPNGNGTPASSKKQIAYAVVIDNSQKKSKKNRGQESQSTPSKSLQKVVSDSEGERGAQSQKSRRWWYTFKYREMLGIVPLSDVSEGLEVAVVERPVWDVDLPGRYVRDYE